MKAASVIDTVTAGETTAGDGRVLVTVGGIAHAGARLIEKVDVQVDDGGWHEAEVREPLSSTTWVVWRVDVPHTAGEHTYTVRCTDGEGALQTGRLHSRRTKLS